MKQSNKVITAAAAIAAAAGLAIGGASLASAESTAQPSTSGTYGGTQGETGGPPGGMRDGGQAQDPSKATHPGETLLTGTVADKVTAAAKAEEPGATIERVETDAEGVYEAHMVRADGTHILVRIGKDFAVTAVQTGARAVADLADTWADRARWVSRGRAAAGHDGGGGQQHDLTGTAGDPAAAARRSAGPAAVRGPDAQTRAVPRESSPREGRRPAPAHGTAGPQSGGIRPSSRRRAAASIGPSRSASASPMRPRWATSLLPPYLNLAAPPDVQPESADAGQLATVALVAAAGCRTDRPARSAPSCGSAGSRLLVGVVDHLGVGGGLHGRCSWSARRAPGRRRGPRSTRPDVDVVASR